MEKKLNLVGSQVNSNSRKGSINPESSISKGHIEGKMSERITQETFENFTEF